MKQAGISSPWLRRADKLPQISPENFFYDRVQRGGEEALLEGKNVLHHEAESLGALEAIEVIPSQAMKTGFEGALHEREGVARDKAGYDRDAVPFQPFEDASRIRTRHTAPEGVPRWLRR